MAFIDQTFFPTAVAGEGTNNKKIDNVSPATNSTTICGFATTTSVRYILAKPLVTNSTSAVPSANQEFGWNILKADMNNTDSTPNKRLIPSGTWVFRCSLSASTADSASSSYGVKVYVHKRSAAGVNTELFNATSTMAAITTTLAVTITKTSVAEILLATDETIHVEYWVQGRGGGATGLLAQNITFTIGSVLDIAVPTLGIRTEFQRNFLATLIGATVRNIIIKPSAKVAIMLGLSSRNNFIMPISKLTTMIGIATKNNYIKPLEKLAIMTGVSSRFNTVKPNVFSSFMIGITSRSNYIKPITKVAVMIGIAGFIRYLEGFRVFTATMIGVPGFSRALIAVRSFLAEMIGLSFTWLKIPQSALNNVVGTGGSIVIRKIFGIFD